MKDSQGERVTPWDGGATALDPLAQVFQKVYSSGWLVTMDETTRIKPLSVPVKAALLGQQGRRVVGAVRQTQAFSLQVLDDNAEKAVEKCRTVRDIVDLLTLPLGLGNHWLPASARSLLETEIEKRNKKGQQALAAALGAEIHEFVDRQTQRFRHDLNVMYTQLGHAESVPDRTFSTILDIVRSRLRDALNGRITPRPVYNRVAAPDLTTGAPEDNWNQPLEMLWRSAELLRRSLADHYFFRDMNAVSCSEEELRAACNAFDDAIVVKPDRVRAKAELELLRGIADSKKSAREKCHAIWAIVKGENAQITAV